jgi:hypothetical protein
MFDLSSILSSLKSPKTALAVFIFSAALLFAPFDQLGIARPAFTTEYESLIVITLFLSSAVITVEFLALAWNTIRRPYYAWRRQQSVLNIFFSLNLEEICLLWAMTQLGTKTIKGSSSNYIMLSLRQKGCLYLVPGIQSANQLHHAMYDDIYKVVSEKGFGRIPDEFKYSSNFQESVRAIVESATDRWS